MISRRRTLQGGGLLAAALFLDACGGRDASPAPALRSADINAQPRDKVADGGTLRLPMGAMPGNFNLAQVDGASLDLFGISRAVLPYPFVRTQDGGTRANPALLVSAEVTARSPQVVTYTVNPRAVWSDGNPITWRDFVSYWRAMRGADASYRAAGTTGYSSITSVARGAHDRQAVVTFAAPFGEWQALFDPFLPASLTSTPDAFNGLWRSAMAPTAGPFVVTSVDHAAQTVTLRGNPMWWGARPRLGQIVYRTTALSALPDALANNEIDCYPIASSVDLLHRARGMPGVVVRNAVSATYNTLLLNGAPGAPLADPAVRTAVAQGIDRAAITRRLVGEIDPGARPAGNHIYVPGTRAYQDHADTLPFDPAEANRQLDGLGWTRAGTGRARGGTPLRVRLAYAGADTNTLIAATVQHQLAQIGVQVDLRAYPGNEITSTISTGNFDIAPYSWQTGSTPLSSSAGVYRTPRGTTVGQNYGRIGTPEIDELFSRAISELDDGRRAELGNQIDRLIWAQAHSVPLYARPAAVAVRANLANYGAPGLADVDYANVGFVS